MALQEEVDLHLYAGRRHRILPYNFQGEGDAAFVIGVVERAAWEQAADPTGG